MEVFIVDKAKIGRINELAKKSKSTGLSPSEKDEQAKLRQEYISAFRQNLKQTLDSIEFVDKPKH